tara:strand:+ start:2787 stop:2933 length:147 start_codon:yes stop_codon:yes gene_type:complete
MIKFITENKNNELELSNRKTKKNDIKNNIDIIKNYKSGFLFWSRLWLH